MRNAYPCRPQGPADEGFRPPPAWQAVLPRQVTNVFSSKRSSLACRLSRAALKASGEVLAKRASWYSQNFPWSKAHEDARAAWTDASPRIAR
jgi:hypothetical protein